MSTELKSMTDKQSKYLFKNHHSVDVPLQFESVYQDAFPNDNQDHKVYHQPKN